MIDTLDPEEITLETLIECYNKAQKLYTMINPLSTVGEGYYKNGIHATFWFIPNYIKYIRYVEKLTEVNPLTENRLMSLTATTLYESNFLFDHNITKVKVISKNKLEIELDLPIFDLEFINRFCLNNFTGALMPDIITVIGESNGFRVVRFGTIELKQNTNIFTLQLDNDLPKGNYTLTTYLSDTPVKFTYK